MIDQKHVKRFPQEESPNYHSPNWKLEISSHLGISFFPEPLLPFLRNKDNAASFPEFLNSFYFDLILH